MKTPNDYLRKALGNRFDEFKQKSSYYHDIVDAIELVQQEVESKRLEDASIKAMQGLLSHPKTFNETFTAMAAIVAKSIILAKLLLKQLDEEPKTNNYG